MQRIRRMTKAFDTHWRVPGTSWRFGLDPVLGLIPAIGGLVTLGASVYGLVLARRVGAPWSVLTAMTGNVALDFFVGEIPLVGDVFDFAFKAHVRNLRLLENWMSRDLPSGAAAPTTTTAAAATGR